MVADGQSRKRYPSELTDEPWAIVAPMSPPAEPRTRGGRPRRVDRREVLNTLLSLNRRGCPGEMLPHDWLPKRTGDDSCAQWRGEGTWAGLVQALCERHCGAAGREPPSRAAGIASPSVKTTEMGGTERGDEGGKKLTGRQRHFVVDPLGFVIALVMTRAGLDDGGAALTGLSHVTPQDVPRLGTSLADQQYHHHDLDAWMAGHRAGWRSDVQRRAAGTQGGTPWEKRWVIERTTAWHGR